MYYNFDKEVILTDNMISTIPADAFPKRGNIQNINFRRNKISSISENAFASQEWIEFSLNQSR